MADASTPEDWKVVTDDVATFDVPRFIRLFTLNRIITNYLQSKNNDTKSTDDLQAGVLVSLVAKLKDKQIHTVSYHILFRLINNGIKTYMTKWYNEKEQATVIEAIFEEIISIRFGQEYQQLTTYYNNDKGKYEYQCQVFNNDDLMREIFRYLTFEQGFTGELHNCSLVHSCWLYHIWNTKLLFGKYDLDEFIEATMKISNENCNNVTRSWERLVNLKYITFETMDNYLARKASNLLISRLSLLRHIVKIECSCNVRHISMIKILMQQCKDKIEMFDVTMTAHSVFAMLTTSGHNSESGGVKLLPPLKLPNCKDIRTNNAYFYPTWTKECKNLEIKNKIDKEWCKHVIDECDCNGIEQLTSKHFAIAIETGTLTASDVFKQFAQKFVNLKQLNIETECYRNRLELIKNEINSRSGTDENISKLSIFELFWPILKKNNGNIHLTVGSPQGFLRDTDFVMINNAIEQFMETNGVSSTFIKHVSVLVGADADPNFVQSRKLVQLCCKNTECLEYVFNNMKIKARHNFIKYIVACLTNMDDINNNDNTNSIDINRNGNDNDDDDDAYDDKIGESFESIQVIDMRSKLTFRLLMINQFFGAEKLIDIFSQHSIFLKIVQKYQSFDSYNSNDLDIDKKKSSIEKFKKICEIVDLIFKKQIPIDIEILFHIYPWEDVNVEINNYKKIYESYFGNINNDTIRALQQYKGAKCNDNKYCVALKFPEISLTWNENVGINCRFVNAHYAQ